MAMDKLKFDRKSLRQFGITMGAAFLFITFIILARHKHSIIPTFIISATFFLLSFTLPSLLKPAYILWMRLAFILSWFNTRLILFIFFYLIFTPIGLIMKLFRIDLLDRKIDKNKESYWQKKIYNQSNPLNYERQF